MAPAQPPTPAQLAEVWGDTVDLRHLAWSIATGIGISVLGFYLASRWLRSVVESPQLAHAYAMLAGLAGCLLGGLLSRFFGFNTGVQFMGYYTAVLSVPALVKLF